MSYTGHKIPPTVDKVVLGDGQAVLYRADLLLLMEFWMFLARNNFQILNSIISLILILVMNQFRIKQCATKVLFHNNPMFAPATIFAIRSRAENDISLLVHMFTASPIISILPPLPIFRLGGNTFKRAEFWRTTLNVASILWDKFFSACCTNICFHKHKYTGDILPCQDMKGK